MVFHRVKSGDNLGKIARMYGTTVNELCRLNGLNRNSVLRLGQSIRCSAAGSTETKTSVAKKAPAKTTTVKADAAAVASLTNNNNVSSNKKAESSSEAVYYRIKSGDTLGAIAIKHGTTVSKLCQLNGISKTTTLRPGRSLRCS